MRMSVVKAQLVQAEPNYRHEPLKKAFSNHIKPWEKGGVENTVLNIYPCCVKKRGL
jgi:hypothetical protein